MNNIFETIKRTIKGSDSRTSSARKNIILSFFLKGISIAISFILVPLTINYLNASEYGIWLTLSSILTWINLFDIGLGNGLRNKLVGALSINDRKLAKTYVSTTFALLILIMFVFFGSFVIANFFLHWDKILNTDPLQREILGKLVVIVFAFFCLQFVFKTVGTITIADQKPAINDLFNVVSSFLSLIIIYILTKTTHGSLSYVAITFSAAPVVVFFAAYFILFWGKYKFLRPSFSSIQFKYTKELVGLGIQFFIIQLAVNIVIYSSTNIILTQLFGSKSVTIYNIAFKYFNGLSMAYMIVISPFWSASTDAYAKNDLKWIQSSIKNLLIIFGCTVLVTLLMLYFANVFYKFWVGGNIIVPLSVSVLVAVYTLLYNLSNTFISFINGIGKIRLQLYVTIIVATLYIPLTVYFGKIWGINGVVLASAISLIPTTVLMPIQCIKLYSNKAKGIWNK